METCHCTHRHAPSSWRNTAVTRRANSVPSGRWNVGAARRPAHAPLAVGLQVSGHGAQLAAQLPDLGREKLPRRVVPRPPLAGIGPDDEQTRLAGQDALDERAVSRCDRRVPSDA